MFISSRSEGLSQRLGPFTVIHLIKGQARSRGDYLEPHLLHKIDRQARGETDARSI